MNRLDCERLIMKKTVEDFLKEFEIDLKIEDIKIGLCRSEELYEDSYGIVLQTDDFKANPDFFKKFTMIELSDVLILGEKNNRIKSGQFIDLKEICKSLYCTDLFSIKDVNINGNKEQLITLSA